MDQSASLRPDGAAAVLVTGPKGRSFFRFRPPWAERLGRKRTARHTGLHWAVPRCVLASTGLYALRRHERPGVTSLAMRTPNRFRLRFGAIATVFVLSAALVTACGGNSNPRAVTASDTVACSALAPFNDYFTKVLAHPSNLSVAQQTAADVPHVRAFERAVRRASNAAVRKLGLEIAVNYLLMYGQHPDAADGRVSLTVLKDLPGTTKAFQAACRAAGYRAPSAPKGNQAASPGTTTTGASATPAVVRTTTTATQPVATGAKPTAPTLPPVTAPHAPWDATVAAPKALAQVVATWKTTVLGEANRFAGCSLYLPTSLKLKVAPLATGGGTSGIVQFTVILAIRGVGTVNIAVWPPSEGGVAATQFPGKPIETFSDGSTERVSRDDAFDVLLAIPGSPCYYELLAPDHAEFEDAFASLREVAGTSLPEATPAMAPSTSPSPSQATTPPAAPSEAATTAPYRVTLPAATTTPLVTETTTYAMPGFPGGKEVSQSSPLTTMRDLSDFLTGADANGYLDIAPPPMTGCAPQDWRMCGLYFTCPPGSAAYSRALNAELDPALRPGLTVVCKVTIALKGGGAETSPVAIGIQVNDWEFGFVMTEVTLNASYDCRQLPMSTQKAVERAGFVCDAGAAARSVATTVPTTTTPAAPGSVPLMIAPSRVGCPKSDGSSPHYTRFRSAPQMCINPANMYIALVQTDVGTIVVKLLAAQDPTTVNNFVFLAGYHFYDGTVFHRVIPGFVDQGGDPSGTGMGGPGYAFDGGAPHSADAYIDGAVAMANSGTPSSDGSQFFIVVGANGPEELEPDYSMLGLVMSGDDVISKINKDGTPSGVPSVLHRIVRVSIVSVTATAERALPPSCPSATQVYAAWLQAPGVNTAAPGSVASFHTPVCWAQWVAVAPVGEGNGSFLFSTTDGLHGVSELEDYLATAEACGNPKVPRQFTHVACP